MAARFTVETVFKMVDKVAAPVTRMQNRVGKFTRAMSKGLNKANRSLNKVIKGLKRGASAALKFGGVAVAAGFAAVALAINKVANGADSLAKIAKRLAFPIEELQEWRFVAEQAGFSGEQFDKSIEKFAKTVGEARAGTGTLITLLKKTNPELLKQVTAAETVAGAFGIYVEGLRDTENQLDKTALATAGFGRSGAKFLNITKQSAKEVAKLRKEMRENGVITKEQAAAAEAYNDATNSLKLALTGLLNNVILPMLPAITKTVKEWRAYIVENKKILTSGIVDFFTTVKNTVLDVWESLKKLNNEYAFVDRLKDTVKFLGDAFAFVAKHGSTILTVVGSIIALSLAIKTATIAMAAFNLITKATPLGIMITLLVGAAALIFNAWEPITEFFANLWSGIVSGIDKLITAFKKFDFVKGLISSVSNLFSFGDGDRVSRNRAERRADTRQQIVSPSERIARSIEESRTTSTAEVTIRDETGRAAVTRGKLGAGIQLQPSGGM